MSPKTYASGFVWLFFFFFLIENVLSLWVTFWCRISVSLCSVYKILQFWRLLWWSLCIFLIYFCNKQISDITPHSRSLGLGDIFGVLASLILFPLSPLLISDSFKKLRKGILTSSYVSVCLSVCLSLAWNNSAPAQRSFMKFYIWNFFNIFFEKIYSFVKIWQE